MKSKDAIVQNWLPRYTGVPLDEFGRYILLVNFGNYVQMFADLNRVPVRGLDKPMPSATAEALRVTQPGHLSWNVVGIIGGLVAVLILLTWGA